MGESTEIGIKIWSPSLDPSTIYFSIPFSLRTKAAFLRPIWTLIPGEIWDLDRFGYGLWGWWMPSSAKHLFFQPRPFSTFIFTSRAFTKPKSINSSEGHRFFHAPFRLLDPHSGRRFSKSFIAFLVNSILLIMILVPILLLRTSFRIGIRAHRPANKLPLLYNQPSSPITRIQFFIRLIEEDICPYLVTIAFGSAPFFRLRLRFCFDTLDSSQLHCVFTFFPRLFCPLVGDFRQFWCSFCILADCCDATWYNMVLFITANAYFRRHRSLKRRLMIDGLFAGLAAGCCNSNYWTVIKITCSTTNPFLH